jgi:hypothetical protein
MAISFGLHSSRGNRIGDKTPREDTRPTHGQLPLTDDVRVQIVDGFGKEFRRVLAVAAGAMRVGDDKHLKNRIPRPSAYGIASENIVLIPAGR